MSENSNIITANRLDDGIVVYFLSQGKWVEDIQQAKPIADADVESAMDEAKKDSKARLVVSIYHFPIAIQGGKIITLSAKEEIRALHKPTIGPSSGPSTGRAA